MPTWKPPETIAELGELILEMNATEHENQQEIRVKLSSLDKDVARLVRIFEGDGIRPSIGERILTNEARIFELQAGVVEVKADLKSFRSWSVVSVLGALGSVIMFLINLVVRGNK